MVLSKLMKFLLKKKIEKTKKYNKKSKVKKVSLKKKKLLKKKAKFTKKIITKKEKPLAKVVHYFSKIKVVVLQMNDTLRINDKIHIKGHTTDFTQVVKSMQIDHKPVVEVKRGQEVGLLVKGKVRRHDKIYRVQNQ